MYALRRDININIALKLQLDRAASEWVYRSVRRARFACARATGHASYTLDAFILDAGVSLRLPAKRYFRHRIPLICTHTHIYICVCNFTVVGFWLGADARGNLIVGDGVGMIAGLKVKRDQVVRRWQTGMGIKCKLLLIRQWGRGWRHTADCAGR